MALPEDNFNRANETPLAGNWSKPTGALALRLISNQVAGPASAGLGFAYWNAVGFPNNQYSEITIASTAGSMDGGPCVRVQSGAVTAYLLATYLGELKIYKFVAGAYADLSGVIGAATAGDRVGLSVDGSTLRAYKNGVSIATITDTAIASGGAPGVFSVQPTGRQDNWLSYLPVETVLSSPGTGALTGISQKVLSSELSSTGTSSLSGISGSIIGTELSFTGSSSFDSISSNINGAELSSSGLSSCSFDGEAASSVVESELSSIGSSSFDGISGIINGTDLSSTGIGDFTGVGSSSNEAVALSSGSSDFIGISGSINGTELSCAGSANVTIISDVDIVESPVFFNQPFIGGGSSYHTLNIPYRKTLKIDEEDEDEIIVACIAMLMERS